MSYSASDIDQMLNLEADEKYKLACEFENGNDCEKNLKVAAKLFISAAKDGCEDALDVFYYNFDDRNKRPVTYDRFKIIEIAANLGYVEAQWATGCRYRDGVSIDKDYNTAFKWF